MIRVDNFKFLSSLSDVRDGHKDSYNLVHESGIYTVFARHILLNEMSGIINLINLIACKDLVLEKAKVVRAPWLEYAENIVLPSACDVDFSCLNFGDIFAMNAKIGVALDKGLEKQYNNAITYEIKNLSELGEIAQKIRKTDK